MIPPAAPVFCGCVDLFYIHTPDTDLTLAAVSRQGQSNILYWFTGTRPCLKCKMNFSIHRVPTSGPNLWLGQLHFFPPSILKQFYHLLKVSFVPILHVLKRRNIVHIDWKIITIMQYGKKPLPKISIPDYSFLFVPS